MNQALALDTARLGMQTALMVSLPILGTSLLIGLLVSLFQAVTQVQEATLTFVPKLIGVGIATALLGNWMLITMIQFVHLCFQRAAGLGLQ
ncbi:MAG: flagellar biosynthetic protein FliQ [Armatimonadetes bacterium]|nr:flagellar type III secretion system protein FliQ [Armatimonadota bacterium]MBS1703649.1 flagellar biosynthetic protein FliQ [Armatimonadota bacterium]MBS1728341.1 flagellar biosynthetic protein FliQ [Armatimonadota bacterium]